MIFCVFCQNNKNIYSEGLHYCVLLFNRDAAAGGYDVFLSRSDLVQTELSFYSATLFLMATFFGEVLSVCSRAVEEDEDDLSDNEEDEQIRRELEEKRYQKDPAQLVMATVGEIKNSECLIKYYKL